MTVRCTCGLCRSALCVGSSTCMGVATWGKTIHALSWGIVRLTASSRQIDAGERALRVMTWLKMCQRVWAGRVEPCEGSPAPSAPQERGRQRRRGAIENRGSLPAKRWVRRTSFRSARRVLGFPVAILLPCASGPRWVGHPFKGMRLPATQPDCPSSTISAPTNHNE